MCSAAEVSSRGSVSAEITCLAIRLGIRIYIYRFYYPREKLEKVFIFAKRDSLNENPVSKTIWTNEDG